MKKDNQPIKQGNMKTTTNTPFANKRDAMLDLVDVNDSNVFAFVKRLMISLRVGTINSRDYELLCGTLQMHCIRESIDTTIEYNGKVIFSLF